MPLDDLAPYEPYKEAINTTRRALNSISRPTVAVGVFGQSNEHGSVLLADQAAYPNAFQSLIHPTVRVPLAPAVTLNGGFHFKLYDDLYRAGWGPTIVNGAIGGLGFVSGAAGIMQSWSANNRQLRQRLPISSGDRGYIGDHMSPDNVNVWVCVDGDDRLVLNTGPARMVHGGTFIDYAETTSIDPTNANTVSRTSATKPSFPANPTYGDTLTETPANGSDKPVKWKYIGKVGQRGYVSSGAVLSEASKGAGFDPFGVIHRLHEEMQRVRADRKIIYIANGQGDLGWTMGIYRDSLKSIANFYLDRGYEVMIGLTNYSPAVAGAAWDTTLKAGRIAALADLKSARPTDKIWDGPDLYTLMGTTGPMASNGGFMSPDNVHLNGRGMIGPALSGVEPAAKHVFDAFKVALNIT